MISDTRLLVERKKSSNFVNIFMRFSQLLSCYQKLDSKNFLLFQKVDHISSNKRLNCKMISAFEKKTNGLTKYSSTQWLADCITSSGFISLSGAKPSNAFSGLIKVLHFNFSSKFVHIKDIAPCTYIGPWVLWDLTMAPCWPESVALLCCYHQLTQGLQTFYPGWQ